MEDIAWLKVARMLRQVNERKANRQEVTKYFTAIWRGEKELRATGVTYEVELTIDLLCRLA